MLEDNVQQNAENTDSVELTNEPDGEFDFEAGYHKEVANAKKQRQSRQKMEKKLEAYEQKEAERKRKRLESEGEFKTIIAELEAENASYKAIVDEVKSNQQKEKEKILETFAEDEREELGKLDLNSLKLVQSKINVAQGDNPKAVPNLSRVTSDQAELSQWRTWDEAKKKANWARIQAYEATLIIK